MTKEQAPVFSPSSECHRIFLNCKSNFIIFGGGAGCGKALKHGEKVLTPSGFKNIEDMQVGDDVITPNNTIEKVTGVFPQGEVDIYKVVFQDGVSVETCGEHLWQYHRSGKGAKNSRVGTTLEMKKLVDNPQGSGKGIPIIPLSKPVNLPSKGINNIHPYVMGILLGDGCFREHSVTFTTADTFIKDKIVSFGYELGKERVQKDNNASTYAILGLTDLIRKEGLDLLYSSEKFIPEAYQYASIEDRYALVQGLLDSDGFASSNGSAQFTSTSKKLMSGIEFVLRSLGYTVTITSKEASYVKDGNRVECKTAYTAYIRGTNLAKVFSLPRKVGRVRTSTVGNRVVSIEKSGRDLATCIAISGEDKLFITTNFVVTHNTHQALMLILKYKDDPNFRAVFIRETSTQLSQAGGLFQEAQAMWKYFGAVFKYMPNMSATFPSGAQVQFKVCGADRDISNYDGGQYSLVIFDEAQNHSEVQVRYLESRIRSKAKGPHQLIATCNPKFNSWLLPFVHPYLDPDSGIPNPDMFAKEMYYGSYGGKIVIGRSKEELIAQYPDISCQSYTFIAATIADNPIMRKLNPEYVKRLEGLKRVERERLLLGSWFAKENNSSYFKRDWVEIIDKPPTNAAMRVRGMDFAATLPSESNPNPDWTASVLVSRTPDFYVIEHVERYRKLTNSVLEHIVETAKADRGYSGDVPVYFPRDPGAAGAQSSMFFIKYLVEHGVIAKAEKSSGHSGKLSRAQPFLSLCEAGLVKVVKGDWNADFFNELEEYVDGKRGQKDDMWDACATAFKAVMKQNTLPSFSLPSGMTQASPIPTMHG